MQKLIFTCENCGSKWKDADVFFSAKTGEKKLSENEKEGLNCPECKSDNVGAVEL